MSRRQRRKQTNPKSVKQKSITRRWTHQSEARHPLKRGQRSRSQDFSEKVHKKGVASAKFSSIYSGTRSKPTGS